MIGITIMSPISISWASLLIIWSLVFLSHPPIINLLGFSRELKLFIFKVQFMSSSKINLSNCYLSGLATWGKPQPSLFLKTWKNS